MTIKDKKWYIRNSPIAGKKFREFHDTLMEKGVLDKKTKEASRLFLSGLAIYFLQC